MFKKEIIVGIVTTVGICGLIYGFLFLKGYSSGTIYYAVYDNTEGLIEGRPVKLNGVQIGQVENINLKPDNAVVV